MSKTASAQVTHKQPPMTLQRPSHMRPTFTITCWLLALIGFAQLITIGTALTVRSDQAPQAVIEKPKTAHHFQEPIQPRSVAEILASVSDSPKTQAYKPLRVPAAPSNPQRSQSTTPASQPSTIANPRVERLIQESRTLQVEDDMMRAMLKLDEATRIDPTEPAVTYHKALLYEEMGMFTQAANHYQQIQQMGIKAGYYYPLASEKLIKGINKGIQKNDLVIGPLKSNKASGLLAGKHVDISIPILARQDKIIENNDVEVLVHFYDRVNGGEIKKADPTSKITHIWSDQKVDWKDTSSEETLKVSYTIPEIDLADEHILGRRKYYGFVVELIYKGDVIDQQAQPRRLHSIHGNKMRADLFPNDPMDQFAPGMPDDGGQLLPNIDDGYGDNPRAPALPQR